jgi:hypothetical protein
MSWRPHGHARVNPRRPQAAGICDRCGLLYTHATFRWQVEWRGERLQNIRVFVCDNGCYDIPQEQLRTRILPPDPIPIANARPEPFTTTGFSYDESNIMVQPSAWFIGSPTDGLEMQMPDGVTVMLMPDNPTGN